MDRLRVVVGLGNVGSEYHGTRHNIGFEVVDKLAEQFGVAWRHESRCRAFVAQIRPEQQADVGQMLWLLKPTTFMNLSGEAIQTFIGYHKIGVEELLVVNDDTALPLGRLRLRKSGSAGGHNGLASVESVLGTRNYARLRCGVGRGDVRVPLHHFVLGRFSSEEQPAAESLVGRAAESVRLVCGQGFAAAMNEVNRVEELESPACN
jgi:PTH1 family peptidyl-tRNA hydrolase